MVRSNYDTLTLKLQDGLDQFERYSEQPKEAAFFKELVRETQTGSERTVFHLAGQQKNPVSVQVSNSSL